MTFRAKALLLICLFGVGATLIWLRHPTAVVLAPVPIPQSEPSAREAVSKLVPKPAETVAESDRKLEPANDAFAFVAKSAGKALDGDGKLARQIGDALLKCLPVTREYRDKPDPPAALENQLVGFKGPDWALDRMRMRFLECRGFIKGNPFAALPDRPGGYESIRFWNDLAYQDNDPVALTQHAADQGGIITGTASAAEIQIVQSDLDRAAATGDSEALFRIGLFTADERVGQDPLNGFALAIAACNLGYDCTTNNEFAFGACVAANMCSQGESYTERVRETIGDENYAKAYSRAQQFQDALARGDTSALRQFVQIKGTP
jgi:hypothetical protein